MMLYREHHTRMVLFRSSNGIGANVRAYTFCWEKRVTVSAFRHTEYRSPIHESVPRELFPIQLQFYCSNKSNVYLTSGNRAIDKLKPKSLDKP